MKAPLSNFIPINRKLFKHEFWLEKRPYSRFEAWLDMIATARFDNSEGRVMIGSTIVRYERGELVASIRYLAERWSWTKNKVESFIRTLKAENMIKTRTADRTKQTIINICNYESYNAVADTSGQQPGQKPDNDRTVAGQQPDKSNKENKEQNSKQREIYRGFAHLQLFTDEYFKLIDSGYNKKQIDTILDEIENYKFNKKYTSLFLTAKKWLEKESCASASGSGSSSNPVAGGRIMKIASAFQDAMQYG